MSLSRRAALRLGLAVTMTSFANPSLFAAGKKIPLGLQLYSVREQAAKDLSAVLSAVGKMGFAGVEFAGYYGWEKKPADLRKLLDDNNLVCCGTHTALDTLQGDNYKRTVELHKTLGNRFLIIPWLDAKRFFSTEQACKETARMLNELTDKAAADNMRVGYHAHAHDLHKLGDTTPWDIIFSNTKPQFIMQLDTNNCLTGGGDPYAILRRYPGRSATIHLKEFSKTNPEAAIGEGDIRWPEIFELCETTGGTEWYIVEHESGKEPLKSVKACIDNLRKMGK